MEFKNNSPAQGQFPKPHQWHNAKAMHSSGKVIVQAEQHGKVPKSIVQGEGISPEQQRISNSLGQKQEPVAKAIAHGRGNGPGPRQEHRVMAT